MTRLGFIFTALALIFPVLADIFVFGMTGQGERILAEPGILLINGALCAIPFLIIGLTLRDRTRVRIALWIGFASVTALWAYIAWDGYRAQTTEIGGGANIGLGLIMMGAPFFLTILILVIAKFGDDRDEPKPYD